MIASQPDHHTPRYRLPAGRGPAHAGTLTSATVPANDSSSLVRWDFEF